MSDEVSVGVSGLNFVVVHWVARILDMCEDNLTDTYICVHAAHGTECFSAFPPGPSGAA